MAYRVSQIRRDTSGDTEYMERLEVIPTTYSSPDPFQSIGTSTISESKSFTDFALTFGTETDQITNETTYVNKFFKDNTYYLRFWIQRIPKYWYSGSDTEAESASFSDGDTLTIRLCLAQKLNQGSSEEQEPLEVIKDIVVNPYVQQSINDNTIIQYSAYSLIFTPTKDSPILVFRIIRNRYDALSNGNPRNWLIDQFDEHGNVIGGNEIKEERNQDSADSRIPLKVSPYRIIYDKNLPVDKTGDICKLNSIVPVNTTWLKFGYQSRPGSSIVVNGQPIIVGRSGIYEINNGTTIKNFMIAAPEGDDANNIDPFLLDYAYNG